MCVCLCFPSFHPGRLLALLTTLAANLLEEGKESGAVRRLSMRSGTISGFGEENNRIPGINEEDIMDEEESFKEEGDAQSEEIDVGREFASSSSFFLFLFFFFLVPYRCMYID